MLVCASSSCAAIDTDPEGNTCTWNQCGWNTVLPDHYFGGCSGGTAGALCCCP
jgi:hypothetical protein